LILIKQKITSTENKTRFTKEMKKPNSKKTTKNALNSEYSEFDSELKRNEERTAFSNVHIWLYL